MRRSTVWAVLLLAGCPPEPPDDTGEPDGCFSHEPEITIGTGEDGWEDLEDGDPIVMIHGPQGGWHILGSARVAHTEQIVSIHYTITDAPSGVIVADNLYTVALTMDEECSGYFPGMYAYLDVSDLESGELDTPPELLAYHDLIMRMTATDDEGRRAEAEIQLVAQPDPDDIDDGT